jgi:hypothetical protein
VPDVIDKYGIQVYNTYIIANKVPPTTWWNLVAFGDVVDNF